MHLDVTAFTRARHQLAYSVRCQHPRVGELSFHTSLWYDSVDFFALEERYGDAFLRRIYFHIVAFDVNRLVSLQPETIDFGPLQDCVTPSFEQLWQRIVHGVWAQWRYENSLPAYRGPCMEVAASKEETVSIRSAGEVSEDRPARSLAFCGGGKDSLLTLRLLEDAGEPYDTLVYSYSVYGQHPHQHELVEGLLGHFSGGRRHRIWIFDDFLPSPVLDCSPELGIRTLCAAETPSSVFAALPVALAHGLSRLVVGHERSADVGNMVWNETGEEVNHQWGKSLEAERLLADYVRDALVRDVDYCSILKPIYDPVIFASLTDAPSLRAIGATHSCNVDKPWCGHCAKCAYVWLNYCAYLPAGLAEPIFGRDLFEDPRNDLWFRQLLGLEEHTPFECVGRVEEVRLAFELCRVRGYQNRWIERYTEAFPQPLTATQVEPCFEVAVHNHALPAELARRILPELVARADRAREWVAAHVLAG